MAFIVTLVYVAFSLLSPSVLPEAIMNLHVSIILGVLACLAVLPHLSEAKLGSIPESFLVFGIFIAMCMSIAATGWLGHVVDIIVGNIPVVLVFYFIAISCKSLKRLQALVYVLLFVALFILSQAAMADRSGDVMSNYLEAETVVTGVIYRYRGLGLLSDPNDLAQLFTFVIPLLWLRWKKGSTAANMMFTVIPALILAVGIYYTHSRGGVVALLAVCLFGFKDKIGLVKSSILAGVLLVGLTALNISGGRGMDEDDGGRVAAWITGLGVFKSHPLFGIGIGNFGDYNETGSTAHNSYVLCLAELGLFGYYFWMGSIVSGWSGLSRVIRIHDGEDVDKDADSRGGKPGRFAMAKPWLEATAAKVSSVAIPLNAMAASAVGSYSPVPQGFGRSPAHLMHGVKTEEEKESLDEDRIAYAAKIFRISLVGLLTSSFFLSRSFSMVFFILLGMSSALNLIYLEKHPKSPITMRSINKRIWQVMIASVVFLYVFVRLRGPR